MKKIILPSLLVTQLFTANVFADTTLKTSDVFVTATRTPISKNNVIADVTTITDEEIERAGSSSLPELLQRQPGIEISNLGGPGKVSTIGIRGTSSTHSIILVDGIRLGAATSGFSAIEHIPLSQIEKIEIVRGPASSLYGQDAIGGVIQIFTNKVVDVVKHFSFMHSLDNHKLALKISIEEKKLKKTLSYFIQVNLGEEDQKSGISKKDLSSFVNYCRNDLKLNIIGLMCLPPINETSEKYFIELRHLAIDNNLKELSMGMSNDYMSAIKNGSTFVRVGSGIFKEEFN